MTFGTPCPVGHRGEGPLLGPAKPRAARQLRTFGPVAARRAEEQMAALRARARALSEQIKAGGPRTSPSGDFYRIQQQLDALARDAEVDEELARIRAEMARRAKRRS